MYLAVCSHFLIIIFCYLLRSPHQQGRTGRCSFLRPCWFSNCLFTTKVPLASRHALGTSRPTRLTMQRSRGSCSKTSALPNPLFLSGIRVLASQTAPAQTFQAFFVRHSPPLCISIPRTNRGTVVFYSSFVTCAEDMIGVRGQRFQRLHSWPV